ncbi:MAG: hypothetical protein ACLQJF_16170 [Candidatus Sulfotelmatobacter sp.]|jgi:hypothetical protein
MSRQLNFSEQQALKAATITVPLKSLLEIRSNQKYLAHVFQSDSAKVQTYFALPAATAPPITIRKDFTLVHGYHRLGAAVLRNDTTVKCVYGTVQDELSAR